MARWASYFPFTPRSIVVVLATVNRANAVVTTTTATTAVTTAANSTTYAATTSTTSTTFVDLCPAATTACDCASHSECAWVSFANGGGRCFYNIGANVDCGLCPSQSKCAGSPCAAFSDPCRCTLSTSSCVWNQGSNACVSRGASGPRTSCSVCSSQPQCALSKPVIIAADPPIGSRGSGVNGVLQVAFNVELKWCSLATLNAVDFWCDGSLTQQISGFSYLYIVASSLRIDISDAMKVVNRNADRVCGITIPADLLCDSVTTAPFGGINKGAYSFTLSDVSSPTVVTFLPADGAADVNPGDPNIVSFTFNEPVQLGPPTLFLTLSTLDTDRSGGASSEVSSKAYALEIPHVRAKNSFTLQFDMKGKTSPGWLYSIALPRGAVADLSGNQFEGLTGGAYTFRTAATQYSRGGASTHGGLDSTAFIVILVVSLAVGGCCFAALVWKFQNACYVPQHYRVKEIRTGDRVPVPKQVQPYKIAQVEPVEHTAPPPPPGSVSSSFHGGPAQNSPVGDQHLSWARAGSPAPKPDRIYSNPKPDRNSSDRSYNRSHSTPLAPEGRNQAADSRSASQAAAAKPAAKPAPKASPKPAPKPEPTSETATSPVVESISPQARAVEKKMRDGMNEPLAARKKMLKDLMLEHHPDKNEGSDSAKEVFQFINGARAWFLHDT